MSFDIVEPFDRDLLAMIYLYEDGSNCDVILRKIRALSPGVAEVFPYSVEVEVGALFSKVGTSKLVDSL